MARDAPGALAAIDTARAAVPAECGKRAGGQAPDSGADAATPLIIDVDATLVTAHSEKEQASQGLAHF